MIEAITENEEVKKNMFHQLDKASWQLVGTAGSFITACWRLGLACSNASWPPRTRVPACLLQLTQVHAILASNTSSISITKLGAATSKPHRVVSPPCPWSSCCCGGAWRGRADLAHPVQSV